MVRHIVAWNYKEEFTEAENKENAVKVKSELEALKGCIDEIIEIKVCINTLPSGNRDIILDSLFESEEALAAYIIHPEHKRVGEFVRSVLHNRACADFHI